MKSFILYSILLIACYSCRNNNSALTTPQKSYVTTTMEPDTIPLESHAILGKHGCVPFRHLNFNAKRDLLTINVKINNISTKALLFDSIHMHVSGGHERHFQGVMPIQESTLTNWNNRIKNSTCHEADGFGIGICDDALKFTDDRQYKYFVIGGLMCGKDQVDPEPIPNDPNNCEHK